MSEDILSALNQALKDEIFFYWVAENFSHWVDSGMIPKDLLEPSRVIELHDYLLRNQVLLLKNLKRSS